jgi:tetratricopeptide (TPR) repeat protein
MSVDAAIAMSSRQRLWRVAGVAAVVLTLTAGLWAWAPWRAAPPVPPDPDLAEVDPEAARLIAVARQRACSEPGSARAWGRLGQALRAHGFGAEANDCFAVAERLDGREPRWPYLRGLTMVLTEPAPGIECLRRAVQRCSGEQTAPQMRLAEVLLEQGRLTEAETCLLEVLEREPHAIRAHLGLGRLALAREDWRSAVQELKACLRDEHARKLARTLLAEAWTRLGEPDSARDEARQAEELPEDEPWPDPFVEEVERLQVGLRPRLARADALARQGHAAEAVALLEETVRKRPEATDAWLLLGQVLLRRQALDPAGRAFGEALHLQPDSVEGWFGLGCVQSLQGRNREAAESFNRAIAGKADHTLAHYNLGQCLRRLNDPDGAARAFRQALTCQPDYAPAREGLEALPAITPP